MQLTGRCNLKCLHCSLKSKEKKFLCLDKIKDIVDCYQPDQVYLSGGDPFLEDSLFDAVYWLEKQKVQIMLCTTGCDSYFYSKLDSLKAKISGVVFPYHSKRKNIHDFMTAVEGSHKKTHYAIRQSIISGLRTEVLVIPTAINIKTLWETVEEMYVLGVRKINITKLSLPKSDVQHLYLKPKNEELEKILTNMTKEYGSKVVLLEQNSLKEEGFLVQANGKIGCPANAYYCGNTLFNNNN